MYASSGSRFPVPGFRFFPVLRSSSPFEFRVLRSNSEFCVLISDLSGGLARVKDRFDRHAEAPHEADDAARLRPDVPAGPNPPLGHAGDGTAGSGRRPPPALG